jgi:hypothetical protein
MITTDTSSTGCYNPDDRKMLLQSALDSAHFKLGFYSDSWQVIEMIDVEQLLVSSVVLNGPIAAR